ncbi:hypothetical protein EV702DRAFT_1048115 [Suillus placidus]|uniref:Uncharacterized protein n=1 Tax=Suillus placidus TaxID=48579 RepID=A0A9P6ZP56_9AGAM|nr:hypothetical protein EV702DRAFT_1048115 [Suillus placidus]
MNRMVFNLSSPVTYPTNQDSRVQEPAARVTPAPDLASYSYFNPLLQDNAGGSQQSESWSESSTRGSFQQAVNSYIQYNPSNTLSPTAPYAAPAVSQPPSNSTSFQLNLSQAAGTQSGSLGLDAHRPDDQGYLPPSGPTFGRLGQNRHMNQKIVRASGSRMLIPASLRSSRPASAILQISSSLIDGVKDDASRRMKTLLFEGCLFPSMGENDELAKLALDDATGSHVDNVADLTEWKLRKEGQNARTQLKCATKRLHMGSWDYAPAFVAGAYGLSLDQTAEDGTLQWFRMPFANPAVVGLTEFMLVDQQFCSHVSFNTPGWESRLKSVIALAGTFCNWGVRRYSETGWFKNGDLYTPASETCYTTLRNRMESLVGSEMILFTELFNIICNWPTTSSGGTTSLRALRLVIHLTKSMMTGEAQKMAYPIVGEVMIVKCCYRPKPPSSGMKEINPWIKRICSAGDSGADSQSILADLLFLDGTENYDHVRVRRHFEGTQYHSQELFHLSTGSKSTPRQRTQSASPSAARANQCCGPDQLYNSQHPTSGTGDETLTDDMWDQWPDGDFERHATSSDETRRVQPERGSLELARQYFNGCINVRFSVADFHLACLYCAPPVIPDFLQGQPVPGSSRWPPEPASSVSQRARMESNAPSTLSALTDSSHPSSSTMHLMHTQMPATTDDESHTSDMGDDCDEKVDGRQEGRGHGDAMKDYNRQYGRYNTQNEARDSVGEPGNVSPQYGIRDLPWRTHPSQPSQPQAQIQERQWSRTRPTRSATLPTPPSQSPSDIQANEPQSLTLRMAALGLSTYPQSPLHNVQNDLSRHPSMQSSRSFSPSFDLGSYPLLQRMPSAKEEDSNQELHLIRKREVGHTIPNSLQPISTC